MGSAREFFRTIKIEHTVFALPFAYATLFLASSGWPRGADFLWITVAMVAGRTFGMAVNRLIDARIDARNPRTASRAIPAGRLSPAATVVYAAAALAILAAAAWRLAPWCRRLWPVVAAAMVLYPYAKRFTRHCHLVLGAVYFMVPTAVWLAVTNRVGWPAVWLGVGAGLWVAGFDVIYATQDVAFDRREGLHSLPADAGVGPALVVARAFHAGFVAALVAAGARLGVGGVYWAGVALTAGILAVEHRMVRADDLSRVGAAFFTANGVASVVLFVMVAVDTVV